MEAMDASGMRLCQMIHDAGLRPGTEQRLQTVLATANIIALGNDGFASHMGEMMVRSIRKFTTVKKHANDLAVLLQPARPGFSLPATLIGLHGDNLFHALVALQLPDVVTKNVHLEAALAMQRLAEQETVDLHIHVYEEIIYIGHYRARDDVKMLAFFDWLEALDAIVQKHVDLVTKAAARQPPFGGPAPRVEEEEVVNGCIFLLASCNQHFIAYCLALSLKS